MSRSLRAVITVSFTVDFDEPTSAPFDWEASALEALAAGLAAPHEGILGPPIEPHVDSIEILDESEKAR